MTISPFKNCGVCGAERCWSGYCAVKRPTADWLVQPEGTEDCDGMVVFLTKEKIEKMPKTKLRRALMEMEISPLVLTPPLGVTAAVVVAVRDFQRNLPFWDKAELVRRVTDEVAGHRREARRLGRIIKDEKPDLGWLIKGAHTTQFCGGGGGGGGGK